MNDTARVRDTFEIAREMAREVGRDGSGIVGYGIAELWHPDGSLGVVRPFANLVTDYGDLYYAGKAIAAIAPASPAAPTALTGMQIGPTGTAVAKSGTGSKLEGAILAGQAFDSTFPSTNNLGAGLGVEAVYKTTYAAGVGTGTVTEATITNGTIGTASTTANTIARITFSAITKAAGDSLAITWRHKFLGA